MRRARRRRREFCGRAASSPFPPRPFTASAPTPTNPRAVAGIYEAKGRPRFNPLIAHIASFEQARREGTFSPLAEKLAQKFWPGPLTLVVPLAETASVCELARAGLPSIGLRMPAANIARDLIAAAGRPIAAPSANRSGHVSPATADHVLADLEDRIDAVLDGGACAVGVESTIVALLDDTPRLLRPGGVAREDIEVFLGMGLAGADSDDSQPLAPGLLASHYAPGASVRLNARELEPGETGLDFAGQFAGALDLSPSGDLEEAAANLFSALRTLDASGAMRIAVAPIPNQGLGEAINDRLARAAAPRP